MIDLIHNMFLATEPFDSIYNGIKTAEYRLYDEKRKKVAVGDTIIFTNRDTGDTVKTAVTYIKTFDNFLSLFSALGCEGEPYRRWTARQLADSMRAYYTEEAEKEHGVVAIGIQLIGPALKIIGRVKNDFPTKFGLPRQGGLVEEIKGYIEFLPQYRVKEALRGLEGYSHIWILWGFSKAEREDWSPTVRPPRLGGNTRMGVFATRSPFRPNSIGMSCVRLEKIDCEKGILYVSGTDMCDGTPVYDIKPYLSFADSVPDAVSGFADTAGERRVEVEFPEDLLHRVPEDKRAALTEVLENDPRPSYQNDSERIYGLAFGGLNVKFTVDEGVLYVIDCEKKKD